MHAPALLLWRDVSVIAEFSPCSAINCKRNPWTVIPLSAWGALTFLRGVLSLKLLPLPIFFVTVPCYLKHMVVEDFSILKPIHSAPPYHATSSYIKMYRRFSESMSSFFEVTNPAFPCSLLHHDLCFSHPAHPAGHKISWQRYRTTSLCPAIPLPHQPPRPYLFLLPPPAYSASSVQPPSVILAIPSAAFLLKSVFSPLMLTSPPKRLPCFTPFACHQPPPVPDFSQTFLALTGLMMEWNSCGMGRAKAPNSLSLFFPSPLFKGKSCKHNFKDWNCTGGTIRSSPESGGKRVQAKANCPSPIVKWKNNRINYLPLWIQRFGKPFLAVYYHQSWNVKTYALWEIVKAGQQKGCRGCRNKDLKG